MSASSFEYICALMVVYILRDRGGIVSFLVVVEKRDKRHRVTYWSLAQQGVRIWQFRP